MAIKKEADATSSFAVRTGLEPATPCVTGTYSNQLNYRTNAGAKLHYFSLSPNDSRFFYEFQMRQLSSA